jgi:hypothetical protein
VGGCSRVRAEALVSVFRSLRSGRRVIVRRFAAPGCFL